jgi:hypothetical protein
LISEWRSISKNIFWKKSKKKFGDLKKGSNFAAPFDKNGKIKK